MIQRIQTIFLALVVLLGITASFLPVMNFTSEGVTYTMNLYKTVLAEDLSNILTKNMGVGAMQGIVILVALAAIFLFKNRSLQIKIGKLIILLIAFQIAAIVMYSDTVKSLLGDTPEEIIVGFNAGAVIPVLSLIFAYLAVRFIKKDDKLVRSADRLR
ncbi:DUF4293 domain-containing protein [Vicingaceae bacterium]|jgi:hypothetical protein|nr:DUF4293 domain-containing protein [Vicingaceae bacterium]